MAVDYAQRLVSLLARSLDAAGIDKFDLDAVIDFVDDWKPDSSELELDGATGLEIKDLWDQWPPGTDYYIEEFEGEDRDGTWRLDDDRFYTEQEIVDLGGYILWQGLGEDPPEGESWERKSFHDVWVSARNEDAADPEIDLPEQENVCLGCGKPSSTVYCLECARNGTCPHGALLPDSCTDCDVAGDLAYDADREGR